MLEVLTVRDYALIEKLDLDIPDGLSVLSGETGAGKSIIMGAMGLLMGGKAESDAVRSGCPQAEVSGVVNVGGNAEARDWLHAQQIEPEEDRIVLRRVVKATGRSTGYVQATPVTVAQMVDLSRRLFDFHGQHDHQSLLAADRQRQLLDRYADVTELVVECGATYDGLVRMRNELVEIRDVERLRTRDDEILRFALREIEAAQLTPGDEHELADEHRRAVHHERLAKAVEEALGHISGEGALAEAGRGFAALRQAASVDQELAEAAKLLEGALFELEEVAERISAYQNRLTFDAPRLEELESRLTVIHALKRKYGDTVEQILAYADDARTRLEASESAEGRAAKLTGALAAGEQRLRQQAEHLSKARSAAATKLQSEVERELLALGMPKARFEVHVEARIREGRPVYGATGRDQAEFFFGANEGEPVKALRAIASGGELSRVMLAVKSILAASDMIETLVFDEVDAGIGGEVAIAVGQKLQVIGATKQVLCITHLATIAAHADNHFRVEKAVAAGRTTTILVRVDGEERVLEIARMLAGDKQAEISRTHARDLLRRSGRSSASHGSVAR